MSRHALVLSQASHAHIYCDQIILDIHLYTQSFLEAYSYLEQKWRSYLKSDAAVTVKS